MTGAAGDGTGAVPPTTSLRRIWVSLDAQGMRAFWLGAGFFFVLQLVALSVYSTFLYHRFDLTDDFATYTQAWWLIGHGHLNPTDTVQIPNYPFWQSHFEVAMWPIALVGRVWPHSIQLLWLQDAAIAATGWIAVTWVAAVCSTRVPRYRSTVGLAATVFLLVNPWWYLAASFDVHFETLGLPFVVWSAYALWRGRLRTALVVGLVAMLFGDVVTVAVLCVGIAGLLSRTVRRDSGWRAPAGLSGAALLWLLFIAAVGGNKGSGIVANYGYLVGAGPNATSTYIVERLVVHPWHVLRVLVDRRAGIGRVVGSAGLVGIASPWGFVVAVGTLAPAALNANLIFLSPTIAFQTLAVIPFVFVGSVLVLVRIARGPRGDREASRTPGVRTAIACGLSVIVVAVALAQNLPLFGTIRADWWKVDAPTAAVLRGTLSNVPADAEVIASQGVIGRFANRRYLYPMVAAPQTFPVRAGTVVFVIAPAQGIESVPAGAAQQTIDELIHWPGVTVLARSNGATALLWKPPAGTGEVTVPSANTSP